MIRKRQLSEKQKATMKARVAVVEAALFDAGYNDVEDFKDEQARV